MDWSLRAAPAAITRILVHRARSVERARPSAIGSPLSAIGFSPPRCVVDAPTTRPDIRIVTKEIHDWSFTRMLNEPAASRNARVLGRLPLGGQFAVPVRE